MAFGTTPGPVYMDFYIPNRGEIGTSILAEAGVSSAAPEQDSLALLGMTVKHRTAS